MCAHRNFQQKSLLTRGRKKGKGHQKETVEYMGKASDIIGWPLILRRYIKIKMRHEKWEKGDSGTFGKGKSSTEVARLRWPRLSPRDENGGRQTTAGSHLNNGAIDIRRGKNNASI